MKSKKEQIEYLITESRIAKQGIRDLLKMLSHITVLLGDLLENEEEEGEKMVWDFKKTKHELEKLTPMGSDFYDDPEKCINWVKNRAENQHGLIIELKKRLKESEEK